MAATLVGEAAIRIVPTLRGFKTQANTELQKTKLDPVRVKVHADTKEASAHIDEWRAKEDLKSVHVRVKADTNDFDRKLTQVEHRVRDSPLHQLTTFNIKILGLDALPALAYAAASAASGLDALGESALALPGLIGGVGASIGTLALGVSGLKEAFSAFGQSQKTVSQTSHELADDNRTLQRSYREYRDAVRDTTREIQDLNAENRRSSLNKADAALSVQEAADRLRQGGFGSITEQMRAQLGYAEAVDHYNDVLTKSNRTQEDANRANAEGVAGSDKVVSALDGINKAVEKLDNDKMGAFGRALQNLSPNAAAAATAVDGLHGSYMKLRNEVQDNLFAGMDKEIQQLAQRTLPTLQTGMARVATGMNHDFKAAMGSMGSAQNTGFMARVFGNDDAMLHRLTSAMDPAITGMMRLTAASSDSLPRLGDAVGKVADRFNNWTDKITHDGSLRDWTNQGLLAMDDIGHIGTGIIGVIHQVGQAFNDVSGHQGGFLKTFADELTKIQNELKSPEGMGKLESYLQGAKGMWDSMRGSWQEMKPVIKDIVSYAREWSQQTLGLVGTVLSLVGAFDRVTHAVGPLVEYFLVMKTLKQGFGIGQDLIAMANAPVRNVQNAAAWWGNLGKAADDTAKKTVVATTATESATTATKAAGDAAVVTATQEESLGKKIEATNKQRDDASVAAMRMTRDVENFVSPARVAADAETTLGSNAERAGTLMVVAGNDAKVAGEQIGTMGAKSEEAGNKVGAGVGLMGKLGGLASTLGPGMLLQVGILTVITLVGKLGDAHRQAAQDAEAQKQALDGLADSMDRVSGAATAETLKGAVDQASKYKMPNLPKGYQDRNLLQDIGGTGTGITPQMFSQALLPANSGVRSQYLATLDQKTAETIPGQDWYKRFQKQLNDAGLDPLTLAKAMNGDPEATKKFTAFRDQQKHDSGYTNAMPDWMPGASVMNDQVDASGVGAGKLVPNLGTILQHSPNLDLSTSAQGLRGIGGALDTRGQSNRDKTDAANGKWMLNDAGHAAFPFNILRVSRDGADGPGIVLFSGDVPPGWAPNGELPNGLGTVTDLPGGQHQVALSADETKRLLIPGFSQGGLIRGSGTGTSDSILAKVSDYEHVSQAAAVKYYSPQVYEAMNQMKIPAGALRAAMGLPHHKTGGFGGGSFKMDGPSPAPKPPPPGPAIVAAPAPKTQWHAAPPPPPPPAPAPDLGAGGLGELPMPGPAAPGVPAPTPGLPGVPGSVPMVPYAGDAGGMPGIAPGMPLPPGRAGEGGMQNDTISVERAISALFPQVTNIGGWRPPDGFNEHSSGQAADVMLPGDYKTPESHAYGQSIKQWVLSNAGQFGVDYVLFDQTQWNADGTSVPMKDRGSDNENHKNHLHVHTIGGGYPGQGQGFTMPAINGLPGGMPGGMLPGGVPGSDMDPTKPLGFGDRLKNLFNPQNMLGNIQGHYAKAFEPKNIMDFLGGQAQMAGSSLMQIGTQFLGGVTGINLAPLLGDASKAGNYGLDMISPTSGGTPGATDMTGAAGGGIGQFTAQGGLGVGAAGSGAPGGYGSPSGGSSGKVGGATYRPLIASVLKSFGPRFGIPEAQFPSWEDALVKQIDTESTGDTGALSTQGDHGILQFKQGTFDQFNVMPGASINDPTAQIAAALNRLTKGGPNAYKMNSDGTPQQIGHGIGWATGGFPSGKHAWVSNGEFKTNGAATSYYGADVYNAMNSMSVPKSSIVGSFAGGDFPVSAPPRALIKPGPPKPPVIPDIPNINVMSDQAQSALGALGSIGGALGGAGAGASAGAAAGGAGGGGESPTAPTRRLGPPQTSVGVPPAPGAPTDLPGPGGVVTSNGSTIADGRGAVGSVGAAPKTNDNLNPAIKGAVAGAINSVAGLAASAAGMAGAAFGGPVGGAAGGAAGSLITGAGQIGAETATDALNVLAGFAVKNQGPANGTALVPQRKDVQMAPPVSQRVHNGDVYTQNLHEWHRAQETHDAQQANPWIQKY